MQWFTLLHFGVYLQYEKSCGPCRKPLCGNSELQCCETTDICFAAMKLFLVHLQCYTHMRNTVM